MSIPPPPAAPPESACCVAAPTGRRVSAGAWLPAATSGQYAGRLFYHPLPGSPHEELPLGCLACAD